METVIDLFEPWMDGVLLESVINGAVQRSMAPVWRPLITVFVLNFLTSSMVADTTQSLLWLDVRLYRNQKRDNDIYQHLMKLEAAYYDKHHPTDILEAVDLGAQITSSLDFVAFQVVPEIITLVGAAIRVFSSYGRRVALVLAYVMLLYALNARHSLAVVMPKVDKNRAAGQKLDRHFNNGVRAWTTVARHNQTAHETETYEQESTVLKGNLRLVSLIRYAFSWSSSLFLQCGYWAAMMLSSPRSFSQGPPR